VTLGSLFPLLKLGVLLLKQGVEMSSSFKSLTVHRGPPKRLNTGRLPSALRSFQLKENRKVAKVLGAQLEGDFHSS
jgi:hypothetical protein